MYLFHNSNHQPGSENGLHPDFHGFSYQNKHVKRKKPKKTQFDRKGNMSNASVER